MTISLREQSVKLTDEFITPLMTGEVLEKAVGGIHILNHKN